MVNIPPRDVELGEEDEEREGEVEGASHPIKIVRLKGSLPLPGRKVGFFFFVLTLLFVFRERRGEGDWGAQL